LYNGVGVIKKFGGSLIGLRLTGQLGTLTQNQDMIFAWTAAEILDEWAPVSVNGNVTGAGFAQLADIGDYLTGLIVTNATAFIIRSQGLSYATATGNATSPFNFNHIGLGETGEGSQITNLVCQYDQTGVFVGNSDVYQISGSISSIGSKIKALLFDVFLNGTTFVFGQLESSNACSIAIGGDVIPVVMICLGGIPTGSTSSIVLFNFNTFNGTWMLFTYPALLNSAITRPQLLCSMLGTFKTTSNNTNLNGYSQNAMVTGIQLGSVSTIGQPPVPVLPVFYSLEEGLANGLSVSNPAFIEFPVEEITFGRDVTMDSIYIALVADLSEDMIVNFSFNGVDFSSVTLEAANFTSLEDNPTEIQLFPSIEVFTAHSPQLRIDIPSLTDEGTAKIRFTKIMSLGSFDPNQRPT
jgi:hypothetical protein